MTHRLTPESALRLAVERIGSQGRMSRLCGVKQPSVWKWIERRKSLPAEYVLTVEAATGVSRHELRPDIYPIEETRSPPSDGAGAPEESTVQSSSGVGPIESART